MEQMILLKLQGDCLQEGLKYHSCTLQDQLIFYGFRNEEDHPLYCCHLAQDYLAAGQQVFRVVGLHSTIQYQVWRQFHLNRKEFPTCSEAYPLFLQSSNFYHFD